jgi:hypothetical protein
MRRVLGETSGQAVQGTKPEAQRWNVWAITGLARILGQEREEKLIHGEDEGNVDR